MSTIGRCPRMPEAPSYTLPEVDRVLTQVRATPPGATVTLARDDLDWLVVEVEGGRDAFGTLIETNAGLRQEVGRLRRTVDTMIAMRNKPNG